MDLWTGISIVVRRWYVALPLLAVSLVVAAVAGSQVQRQYRAGASVVLVAPQAKIVANVRQPLDNPFDTRSLGAAVLRRLGDTDLAHTLEGEGFATDYTVGFDRDASIIDLAVTAATPEQAVATARRLIDEAQAGLDRTQADAGVATEATISLDTVTLTERADPERGDRFRVVITVVLLGIVVSISAALLTESYRQHRAGLGRAAEPGVGGPTAEPGAGGPTAEPTRGPIREPALAGRTVLPARARPAARVGQRAMPPPAPGQSPAGRGAGSDPSTIDLRARWAAGHPEPTADGSWSGSAGGPELRPDDGPPPAPHDR